MKTSFLTIFLLLFFLIGSAHAQRKRSQLQVFEGGLLAGFNLSQIDGDYFTGFDQIGWYGGVRGVMNLDPRFSFNMELLFSQKGSKIPHGTRIDASNEGNKDRTIALNYAEVPLLFKFQLKPQVKSPFLEAGLSYSRLLQAKISEKEPRNIRGTIYEQIVPEFTRNDLAVTGGLGYGTKNIDLTFRYTFSFNKFYINDSFVKPDPLSSRVKEVAF